MKKLTMKLEDLRVNSFETGSSINTLRGTVRGNYVVVISGTSACDFHTWTDGHTNDCYNDSMNCP